MLCAKEENSGYYAVAMAGMAFVVMCGAVAAALLLCCPWRSIQNMRFNFCIASVTVLSCEEEEEEEAEAEE